MMFSDPDQSHAHSLEVLEVLDNYGDFKNSIRNVLDIGCGEGHDLRYWADMTADDDDGTSRPLNIYCVGIDRKIKNTHITKAQNIELFEHDFNTAQQLPFEFKFDVVWCHDTLQYAHSPLHMLGQINRVMAKDSMLYLCVPSTVNVVHKKFKNYTFANQYSTFTITQLIYYLALNGFDCKDAYFRKRKYEDVIEVLVYKNTDPLDYNLSWYELDALGVLSDNMHEIVDRIGYLTDNGLITMWLDGEVFDYRHHS